MIKTDLILGRGGGRGPEAQSKAKGEMRKPPLSQGKSFTPWEENGNSNSNPIPVPHLDKACKVLRSK